MHQTLSKYITRENVENLGFIDWDKTAGVVDQAFADKDPMAIRYAFCVAQWVVLAQRFNIPRATSDESVVKTPQFAAKLLRSPCACIASLRQRRRKEPHVISEKNLDEPQRGIPTFHFEPLAAM